MRRKAPAVTGLALAGLIILYFLAPGSLRSPGSDTIPAAAGKPAAAAVTVGGTDEDEAADKVGTTVEGTVAESTTAKGTMTGGTDADEANTAGKDSGPKLEDSPIKPTDTEGIVPGGTISATVKRVVDGDTLVAVYKNKDYRVRLLCIDTPESVMSGVEVQPYGKEASERLKELVEGKAARLVFEKDTDDRYGRLLAYVLLDDGACVNSLLLTEGFARVDFVKPNTVNKEYFTRLMEAAISQARGLWSLPGGERPFVKDKDGNYYPVYYDEEKAA